MSVLWTDLVLTIFLLLVPLVTEPRLRQGEGWG
jgi:hypothetical protein